MKTLITKKAGIASTSGIFFQKSYYDCQMFLKVTGAFMD